MYSARLGIQDPSRINNSACDYQHREITASRVVSDCLLAAGQLCDDEGVKCSPLSSPLSWVNMLLRLTQRRAWGHNRKKNISKAAAPQTIRSVCYLAKGRFASGTMNRAYFILASSRVEDQKMCSLLKVPVMCIIEATKWQWIEHCTQVDCRMSFSDAKCDCVSWY